MKRRGVVGLAVRVVRGTGVAGAVRTLVLLLAMAIAVAAALTIAFVPAIASHRVDAMSARALRQPLPGYAPTFSAASLDGSVGDRPLRRVFIASTPDSPTPPGVDQAPRAGEVFASPALRSLIEDEAFVRPLVPGRVVGEVAPEALADPDELFAYVGVADSGDLNPMMGFGGSAVPESDGSSFIALQLALFVLVPAGGFLVVAATLSSRARSRRWDAMRSVSTPESTIGWVGALETGLVSVAGGALGLLIFAAVRVPVTRSGFGGLRWFPEDFRLTLSIAITTLVLVSMTGAMLGRRATRIRPVDSMHDVRKPLHPARRALPLVCGATMLSSIVVQHHLGKVVRSSPVFLVGALLAVLGLGLVLVPFVKGVAGVVARHSRRLAWRLGGHRASYEPRSIVRILAGLVALIIVGHLTFAVLSDLRLAVGGDINRVVASASVDSPEPRRVADLVGLRPASAAIGRTAFEDNISASVAYLECDAMQRMVRVSAPCQEGASYRVSAQGFPSDLVAGQTYRFETRRGATVPVDAPTDSAEDRFGVFDTSTLLVAGHPPSDLLAIGEVRYVVDRADLIRLQSEAAAIDPQLLVDSRIEPAKVESYDQQVAVARVGAMLGGLLATLCFVVASVDRLLERRSHTATLVAIGMPRPILRTSQIAQLLLPLIAALAAANLVGWLIAQSYLAMGGLVVGVPYGLLGQGLALSAAAVVVAVAVGAVVSIPNDIVTQLRAE